MAKCSLPTNRQHGFSLVETLIAIALVGGLLVPLLFFSSAYFSRELVKNRQQFGLYHNTAKVLHAINNEIGQCYRILSDSTSTELHYAIFDPVQQTEIKRGFKLTTSGSDLKLQRLNYNTTSGLWTATTPYGVDADDRILIASGTTFDYCSGSDCTVNPEKALSLRLDGWAFTDVREGRTLTLPSVQFYLAPAADTNFQLSESPKELFSTTISNTFGSTADFRLTSLTPDGNWLENLTVANGSAISTILTGQNTPGQYGIHVDPTDGRGYFVTTDGVNDLLHTWAPLTGLSTIATLTDASDFADANTAFDESTHELFFINNGKLNLYSPTNGLSTLANGDSTRGALRYLSSADGGPRIYNCASNYMYTWTPSFGLSTMLTTNDAAGFCQHGLEINTMSGQAYFAEGGKALGTSRAYSWGPSTGLSTIIEPGGDNLGKNHTLAAANSGSAPGALIADYNTGSILNHLWYWDASAGALSTLLTNQARICEQSDYNNGWNPLDHSIVKTCAADSTGRFFIGTRNALSDYYIWSASDGLSTILENVNNAQGVTVDPVSDRAFFGQQTTAGASQDYMWSWHQSTGLSTLRWASKNYYMSSATWNSDHSKLYFHTTGNGILEYELATDTTTTQLSSGPAVSRMAYDSDSDLMFLGGAGNNAWAWNASTGLSTIITSAYTGPGELAIKAGSSLAYFGDNTNPGNFYAWSVAPKASGSITRNTAQGNPTGQTHTIGADITASYTAMLYDDDDAVFLLDSTNKDVERYTYVSGAFTLASSLGWSGGASIVQAMAIDNSGTGIALLDAGNNEIDVYSDRTVNGAATPASTISLSALGVSNPTGLAISGRTGNYLVLDSTLQIGTYVRLFIVDTGGSLVSTINIDVTASNLSAPATTESNFKILYNEQTNVLYLLAPNLDRMYALSLPSVI